MIDLSETAGIYLYPGFTDMRCGIRSLTIKVAASFAPEKYKKSLFIFCGRNKHSIKILEIDDDGTWLYQKRVHDGRFKWPREGESQTISLTKRQIQWLLAGLSIVQKGASKEIEEMILY